MASCNCQRKDPAKFVPYPGGMPMPYGPVPPPPVGMPPPNPLAVCMANRQSNVVAGENIEVNRVVNRCSGQNTYIVTGEVDKDWVESELAKKADKTYVNTELAKKADKTYVNTELAKKADKTYVNTELAKKADKTYVNTELAKKADKTYVNTELAKKADKTYVNTELAKKADKTYVDTELAKKASITYVDGKVAPKADKSYVDLELAKKANTAYVDEQLALKANSADVEAALVTKVDKEAGKGLYPDEDKEKLAGLPSTSEDGVYEGHELTLVTTGEKYTWDNKQDELTYYLENARINPSGDLEIDRYVEGSIETLTFSASGAINNIALDTYGDLEIDDKRVTIPLATTDGNIPGIVRGASGNFNDSGEITI